MLVEALGDNGIIALDIDAAAPAIAANANHILREGYGPRFAVEFRTQRQDSDG
jgi:DNA repair protein SbcC/Rad50